MSDSIKRSAAKTVSWHVLHFVVSGVVALIITHRFDFAALIASAELLWESAIFFFHERAWARIGKNKK
jgi:uncharacterized membrane protein